jgi:hypothetical protein
MPRNTADGDEIIHPIALVGGGGRVDTQTISLNNMKLVGDVSDQGAGRPQYLRRKGRALKPQIMPGLRRKTWMPRVLAAGGS